MTPLPGALGGSDLVAWRLDQATHAATWDSGEGAYRVGGRWSSRGTRAVYCALDPATAILEVAVHKGFKALDVVPHVLTEIFIPDAGMVHVVNPKDVPNSNWLRPGAVGAGQQAFGDALLVAHKFVVFPSVVSTHSWNMVFGAASAAGAYALRGQEASALDPRLHLPAS